MGINIITPQFERTWELDYDYIPQDDNSFYATIQNASIDVLVGMGFGRWDTIKSIVAENQKRPIKNEISIPILNGAEDELFVFDAGRKNAPIEMPEVDMQILLFPEEWYNHIPEGFVLTSLNGEQVPFKRGETDDDTRFGCIAYGIMKPIE